MECGIAKQKASLVSMATGEGEFYETWRKQMIRAVDEMVQDAEQVAN